MSNPDMAPTDRSLSKILDVCMSEARREIGKGRVADYIPALARINPDQFNFGGC